MAWSRVQKNNSGSASSTWGSATAAGNLLVAAFSCITSSGNSTVTPPAGKGWTAGPLARQGGTPNVQTFLFYNLNSASQSGSQTFTATGSPTGLCLEMAEYTNTGVSTTTHNQDQTNTGAATTSPSTGTTAALAGSGELAIASIDQGSATDVFSAPTNSYTLVDTVTGSALAMAFLENLSVGSAGTGVGVTSSISLAFAGAVMTFTNPAGGHSTLPLQGC